MNVLEGSIEAEDRIDRSCVERRIDGRRRSIAGLDEDVARWLPERWTVSEGGSVSVREELMQRSDLSPESLPILNLHQEGSAVGRLEPRGLRIVGANGRIDMILPERHFLLVDRSEKFEDAEWFVAPIEARRDQKPFSREPIRAVSA